MLSSLVHLDRQDAYTKPFLRLDTTSNFTIPVPPLTPPSDPRRWGKRGLNRLYGILLLKRELRHEVLTRKSSRFTPLGGGM